jgi:membrane fusion protein
LQNEEKSLGTTSFFRREVYLARENAWLGEVSIAQPVRYTVLAIFAVVLLIFLSGLLWFGKYTKKALATGYVTTDKGVISITARSPGTVLSLKVVEGDVVKRGEVLVVLDVDVSTLRGPIQGETNTQLAEKRKLLEGDLRGAKNVSQSELSARTARIKILDNELASVGRQLENQKERLTIVETILTRYKKMFEDGFISDLAFQDRAKESISERNLMESMQRTQLGLEKEQTGLRSEIDAINLKLSDEQRRISASLTQLAIDELQGEGRKQVAVISSIDGKVGAIATNVGRAVRENQTLISIVPTGSTIQVDLYVPTVSAGLVKSGSFVAIHHRSFPSQKYGVQRGSIIRVADSALSGADLPFPAPTGELYFLASVKVAPFMTGVNGPPIPLRPGMTVDGRIELESRRIISWLFEPLFRLAGNT